MIRKDFQLIADVIKEARNIKIITVDQSKDLTSLFCRELCYTNKRFDNSRFITACLKEGDK